MATYRCNNCGYKVKKETIPQKCGYCGKANVLVETESAEKLLEEL